MIAFAVILSVLGEIWDIADDVRRDAERVVESRERDRWNGLSLQEKEAEIWAAAPGPASPRLTLQELEARIEAALCKRAHQTSLQCSIRFEGCVLSVEHAPAREGGLCTRGAYQGRAFRLDLERILTFEAGPSPRGSYVERYGLALRFAPTAERPHKSLSQELRKRRAALHPTGRDIGARRRLARWLDEQEPGLVASRVLLRCDLPDADEPVAPPVRLSVASADPREALSLLNDYRLRACPPAE
ncbi:MAG: hypothetical protein AAGI51_04110 [Pseudomonadota bacterium]